MDAEIAALNALEALAGGPNGNTNKVDSGLEAYRRHQLRKWEYVRDRYWRAACAEVEESGSWKDFRTGDVEPTDQDHLAKLHAILTLHQTLCRAHLVQQLTKAECEAQSFYEDRENGQPDGNGVGTFSKAPAR